MEPVLENAYERESLFRHSPVPVAAAMVEMPSMRLTPNNAFAALLRLDDAEARSLNLVDLVYAEDWPVAEHLLAGVASGLIESCQGRGRLRPPRGGDLDVVGWVRPVDGSRPCTRAVLAVVPADGAPPLTAPWFARVDTKRVVFGSVDHDWRFSEVSPDATELLGWDRQQYRGSPLQRAVHPDDVPLLLLTLGRSGAERRAVATRLRVRGPDDAWTPVRCTFSPLCDHNPPRFGFGLWLLSRADDVETANDRVSRLEGHLWRIAAEIQAAGITDLPKAGDTWWADPALRGLTDRQAQILRRLISGERVPAIGRALFLSESTVRNHLSAIFRQVGVHSQSELLTRLIGRPAPP
jgi:DNA-binding CsgD family transcriptional regulator